MSITFGFCLWNTHFIILKTRLLWEVSLVEFERPGGISWCDSTSFEIKSIVKNCVPNFNISLVKKNEKKENQNKESYSKLEYCIIKFIMYSFILNCSSKTQFIPQNLHQFPNHHHHHLHQHFWYQHLLSTFFILFIY